MNTAQIPVSFTSNTNVLNARQLIVRKGAVGRYDEAIQYLREELKNGGWSPIKASEFANTFKITGDFLHLCTEIGAIESTSKRRGQPRSYKALPKLATLTGQQLRDYRLSDFPNPPYVVPEHLLNKTSAQRQEFVNTMNTMNTTAQIELTPPIINLYLPEQPEPLYLVGSLEKGNGTVLKLQTAEGAHFHDLETARSCVQQYPANVGTKIVLVQVIEVVESSITLQPATL